MSEHLEQVALFNWAKLSSKKFPELALMYSIPNGSHRHIAVARKLKAEGVKRGVPDICLPVARGGYHGLYIELKKPKGTTRAGKPTKEQVQWLSDLGEQGYLAVLCVGWEAARKTIDGYLES